MSVYVSGDTAKASNKHHVNAWLRPGAFNTSPLAQSLHPRHNQVTFTPPNRICRSSKQTNKTMCKSSQSALVNHTHDYTIVGVGKPPTQPCWCGDDCEFFPTDGRQELIVDCFQVVAACTVFLPASPLSRTCGRVGALMLTCLSVF